MTTKRLTKRREVLERHRGAIIADIIEGMRDVDIATKYGVSRAAVNGFNKRYAVEIVQGLEALEAELERYAIASKVNRIAAKDRRWQLLEALRQARAKGKSGEDTGLGAKTYKTIGQGEDATLVVEFKLDGELLAAMERAERSTAEELGQLPKPGGKEDNPTNILVLGGDVDLGNRSSIVAFANKLLEARDAASAQELRNKIAAQNERDGIVVDENGVVTRR